MEQPEVTISILQGIGISVVASFIVLILVGISKLLWSWFLCNLWLKLSCRHITDISGKWIFKDEDNSRIEEITVEQFGWKVRGKTSYHQTQGDKETNVSFLFEGIFRDNILSAIYWNDDRKQKGVGSFCLQLMEDGSLFEGRYLCYVNSLSNLENCKYWWKRK